MAIQMLAQMLFPQLSAVVYYDDVALVITRVEVNNSGNSARLITVSKLDPPKRTFSQVFQAGTNVGYNVPTGFKLTVELNEDGELVPVSLFTITVGDVV